MATEKKDRAKVTGLTTRQRNLALLAGLSVALYVVENLIPLPVPWLRIGLGNIGVVLALYLCSEIDGFWVLLIKIIAGSLFSGRFLSPFFLFALGAGLPSYWIMAGSKRFLGRWLSPVGVSIMGAVFHNMFQLLIAYLVVVRSLSVYYLTPIMIVLGTGSGMVIGILVKLIITHIDKNRFNGRIADERQKRR